MSSFRPKTMHETRPRAASSRRVLVLMVAVIVAVGVLIAAALGTGGPAPVEDDAAPFPGEASEVARAGGVEVDGSLIEMGRVPLNTTVVPTWTLRNTTDEAIVLGDVHVQIVEGCCPGETHLGTQTLAPGTSTELTFPLEMHPGMDGPHDFLLHVPAGAETLELRTTADFR